MSKCPPQRRLRDRGATVRRRLLEQRDPIPVEDQSIELCQWTQLSRAAVVASIAECSGKIRKIKNLLHINHSFFGQADGGYWNLLAAWMRMYIPQWEQAFRYVTQELENTQLVPELDPQRILTAAAQAMGIDEAVLLHYAQNRQDIEAFLELQRASLGTMAEVKLWQLIQAGDPATIRWTLTRLKPEIYGGQGPEAIPGDNVRNIRIINVTPEK